MTTQNAQDTHEQPCYFGCGQLVHGVGPTICPACSADLRERLARLDAERRGQP